MIIIDGRHTRAISVGSDRTPNQRTKARACRVVDSRSANVRQLVIDIFVIHAI